MLYDYSTVLACAPIVTPGAASPSRRLDPAEDEHSLHMLYDYSTVLACAPIVTPGAASPSRRLDPAEDEHSLHMLYDYSTVLACAPIVTPGAASPSRRLDPAEDEHSLHMLYDYSTVLACAPIVTPGAASPSRRLDPAEDEHSLHMLYDYSTVLACAPIVTPGAASPSRRLDPAEDEHSLHMLYDYSTVLACAPIVTPGAASPSRRLDPAEDEHSLHMLYDYSTVLAWLDHPVKRFKTETPLFREELALGAALGADLYAGHDHTSMAAMPAPIDVKQEKVDHEDVKEYKNLFTSDGLCPTLKDLEQIFDNSDDANSGDETLQVQTPPDSNKSAEESRCAGGRCVRAEELSKMFPTPPSMEAHAQPSPGFTLPDDAPAPHQPGGSPPPDPIEDWSYVFKPPTLYKYVGSSKYAPLTQLPSQLLPPLTLPPNAVYRPRAERRADAERAGVKRSASPSSESRESNRGRRGSGSATPAAAGAAGPGVAASPAPAPVPAPAPEPAPAPAHAACPLLVNVLLADTVLNVFRDHNFDSCTLCVCNAGPKVVGNIRGADAATYLAGCSGVPRWDAGASPGAADDEPARCTCGFSAVVNRRRAHTAGLFYEDEMEITGLAPEPGGALGAGGARGGGRLADVAGVVAMQCAAPAGGAASALARAAQRAAQPPPPDELRLNLLE
ncbi:uncharacterized protein LOC135072179 [Ostrinia nubilalis]|uniref:uncharacterized protein LOC135072179 n=1 Tax=Ostrinia nubilalis TaxID=29057 RepID=UPI003082591D